MAASALRRREVEPASFPTAERAALGAAVADRVAAAAAVADAQKRYDRRWSFARPAAEARDAARAAFDAAREAAVSRTVGGPAPRVSVADARAELQAAEDGHAAAVAARDRLGADLEACRADLTAAEARLEDAALDVLRAEAGPVALRLAADIAGLQLQLFDAASALRFLVGAGAVSAAEADAAAPGAVARLSVAVVDWEHGVGVVAPPPGAAGDAPWRAALSALKLDPEAALPAAPEAA